MQKRIMKFGSPFIKNISGYKNIIFLSQTSVTKGINLIGEYHDLSSLEKIIFIQWVKRLQLH